MTATGPLLFDLHQAAGCAGRLDCRHLQSIRWSGPVGTFVSTLIAAGAAVVMLAAAAESAGQAQVRQREQVQQRAQERAGKREIIPGSELMTSAEREAYRRRYAAAKTEEDREKVRAGHVKAMQERARVRGLQLAEPRAPAGGGGK
jgi:hypothetical protein